MTSKLKQARLYQYNSGEYERLERIKAAYLQKSASLSFLEEQTSLNLSK